MIRKLLIHNITFLALFALLAPYAHAGISYSPISGSLPIIGTSWPDIATVLNALLGMSVGVAAILAVIMLAIGGFKYMTSESVFKMGSAKEQITNAIVGLLIVLAAVVVLKTINSDITSMRLFTNW